MATVNVIFSHALERSNENNEFDSLAETLTIENIEPTASSQATAVAPANTRFVQVTTDTPIYFRSAATVSAATGILLLSGSVIRKHTAGVKLAVITV